MGLRKVCHQIVSNCVKGSSNDAGRVEMERSGKTYDLVLGLIPLRLEVEVVLERVLAALVCCCEDDAHVKLSPTLLVDAEWRLLEGYAVVSM